MDHTTCACCNKCLLTEKCEECDFEFCNVCREKEGHTGTFTCSQCKDIKCNTYLHDIPNNRCWSCVIKNSVASLNNTIPGLGDMALEQLIGTQ